MTPSRQRLIDCMQVRHFSDNTQFQHNLHWLPGAPGEDEAFDLIARLEVKP
mgnify:CR=1 FL=1